MSYPTTQVTRRSFTAMAGAALAGTAVATAFKPQPALAAEDVNFDETCDVLVIGSGYAGLAAAYEAKKAGADVRVIEKRGGIGGNSYVADSGCAVMGSPQQAAAGIKDSVDDFVGDMLNAGLNLNDVEKCQLLAEKSNETFSWTIDEIGVDWLKDEDTGDIQIIHEGGHTTDRCFVTTAGRGSAIVDPLAEKLSELGCEVELQAMLTNLVVDATGRVVGAQVAFGVEDNDPTTASETKLIGTTKGIVLASGGYGSDLEWRMVHDPRLDETVDTTNREGSTAEAIQIAMKAGALPVHLDWIQCGPWCSPDDVGYGPSATLIQAECAYVCSVARTTGRRVVNEMTDRKRFTDAILETGEPLIQIASSDNVDPWIQESLDQSIEVGATREFDTLDAIAEEYDLPADALKEQLDEYNSYVEAGVDEQFGKIIPAETKPTVTAPFYVTRLWPKVHHCMGGVKTNLDCQVLDMFLEPIPGLYAAGECVGGVHGACRVGCMATIDCLVNGRIAGQNIANA